MNKENLLRLAETLSEASIKLYEESELLFDELGILVDEPYLGNYQGAYDYEFTRTYNGYLDQSDLNLMKLDWIDAVESVRPITKEMYKRASHNPPPTVWGTWGGLKVQTLSIITRSFSNIVKEAYELAAGRAEVDRQKAGWTGPRFLTDPFGNQKNSSGSYWMTFQRP